MKFRLSVIGYPCRCWG